MKIYFSSDHAGFELKSELIEFVRALGYEAEDCGPSSFNEDDDFPDFVIPMAQKVAGEHGSFGIVVGASGQGEAMAANRVKGIRAAVYYGPAAHPQTDAEGNVMDILTSTRAHNNANVLSIGARFVRSEDVEKAVRLWLSTPFSGDERHVRRLTKLDSA
ncbi:MAG TPA: RpiB/LacA/LacB family sugar-phosphate isomerase [Candidatus Paceibacterota bacterium]|nr:RpiB/LacA/LacB family sugar-phosphate isomerase [Candidatus Paceibacterota bacterium]